MQGEKEIGFKSSICFMELKSFSFSNKLSIQQFFIPNMFLSKKNYTHSFSLCEHSSHNLRKRSGNNIQSKVGSFFQTNLFSTFLQRDFWGELLSWDWSPVVQLGLLILFRQFRKFRNQNKKTLKYSAQIWSEIFSPQRSCHKDESWKSLRKIEIKIFLVKCHVNNKVQTLEI